MFLRRWNYTRSNRLAKRYPATTAKLPRHPLHSLPTIHNRALHSAQNATLQVAEEHRPIGLSELSIQRTSSAQPEETEETLLNHTTICRIEFPKEDFGPQHDAITGSSVDEEQKASSGGIEICDDEFNRGIVEWSPRSSSEKRHGQQLQRQRREDGGFPGSLNTLLPELKSNAVSEALIQTSRISQQDQDSSTPLSDTASSESSNNGAWTQPSLSRPLYSSLHERFQLPLTAQQTSKLQNMVKYYKERSMLTTEFGKKSHFSYDWMRPLEILQHEAQLEESDSGVPYDDATFSHYTDDRASAKPSLASEIQVPTDWTTLSFAAFVTKITRLRPRSRDRRHNRYARHLSVEVIDACLMSLFQDPNMHEYLTVDAFNSALTFYSIHKHHGIHRVREMYNLMEKLKMDTDPRTFVIMFKAAAGQHDLAFLSYLLFVMVRKGVRPTRKVWLTLLETVQAKIARLHIIRILRERGLLEDVAIARAVVGLTVPPEVPNHIRSKQNVGSFLHLIDTQYGHEWHTTETGNRMTWELCNEGLFSDALRVWYLLQARGCLPDAYTLTIFLRHSKAVFDIGTSIEIIRHFWRLYAVGPDATGHELLFRHAWTMRSYNCCKAVWFHACLEKLSHSKIDSMLIYSLTKREEAVPVLRQGFESNAEELYNPSDAWFKGAGKLVIESDPDVYQALVQQIENLGATRVPTELMPWEGRWDREVARQSIQNKEDTLAGKQLRDEFADILLKAYDVDGVWRRKGHWMRPTRWKVENAISLPLVDRQPLRFLKEDSEQNDSSPERCQRIVLPQHGDGGLVSSKAWFKKTQLGRRGRRRRRYPYLSVSQSILRRKLQLLPKSVSPKQKYQGISQKRRERSWHCHSLSPRLASKKQHETVRKRLHGIKYKIWQKKLIAKLEPLDTALEGPASKPKALLGCQPDHSLSRGFNVHARPTDEQSGPVFPVCNNLGSHCRLHTTSIQKLSIKDKNSRSMGELQVNRDRRLAILTDDDGAPLDPLRVSSLPSAQVVMQDQEQDYRVNALTVLSDSLEPPQTLMVRHIESHLNIRKCRSRPPGHSSSSKRHNALSNPAQERILPADATVSHLFRRVDARYRNPWIPSYYYKPFKIQEGLSAADATMRHLFRRVDARRLNHLSRLLHVKLRIQQRLKQRIKQRIKQRFKQGLKLRLELRLEQRLKQRIKQRIKQRLKQGLKLRLKLRLKQRKALSNSIRKPSRATQSAPSTRGVLRQRWTLANQRARARAPKEKLDLSRWLDSLGSRRRSGYKPLRDPVGTASFFQEARVRIAIRELQALDLSLSEVPVEAPWTTSESAVGGHSRHDNDVLGTKDFARGSFKRLPLFQREPGKSKKEAAAKDDDRLVLDASNNPPTSSTSPSSPRPLIRKKKYRLRNEGLKMFWANFKATQSP